MMIYRSIASHQQLLQAALSDGDAAIVAWEQWHSSVDIEVLEDDAYVLLPQLYQNLLALGIEHQHMARLKGIYRRHWCADRLQLQSLQTILAELAKIGIEAIVLGDAAASFSALPNHCPISCLEILVRADRLELAASHLTAQNWQLADNSTAERIHLQDERGRSLYLQRHLFWAMPQDVTDERVWQFATPNKNAGAGWQLSPTDRLLHICDRTFFKTPSARLDGIADALILLCQSGRELDWQRLIAQAQTYRIILPARNMLRLLERLFQPTVPEWVLPALSQLPISQAEWMKYRVLEGDGRANWRSTIAPALDRLGNIRTKLLWLRYRYSFPGKQALKSILIPPKSNLE